MFYDIYGFKSVEKSWDGQSSIFVFYLELVEDGLGELRGRFKKS